MPGEFPTPEDNFQGHMEIRNPNTGYLTPELRKASDEREETILYEREKPEREKRGIVEKIFDESGLKNALVDYIARGNEIKGEDIGGFPPQMQADLIMFSVEARRELAEYEKKV